MSAYIFIKEIAFRDTENTSCMKILSRAKKIGMANRQIKKRIKLLTETSAQRANWVMVGHIKQNDIVSCVPKINFEILPCQSNDKLAQYLSEGNKNTGNNYELTLYIWIQQLSCNACSCYPYYIYICVLVGRNMN